MKNNRTFLEKLLDGAEVEWKPLGDVCNFQNGFAFKSSLFKDNGSPIVRITNIDGGRINLSDVKYFLMDDYNTDMAAYEVHKDDILIAMSGATTGKIGFYNYEHTSYLNQRVGKFLPNTNILNNRYLYHYLLSKVEDIYIISGGGAQPNLSSNRLMSEVLIPIPPLSVQTEIVKILDALTALTSELTSELTLRRKQYEYYLDNLLSKEELGKIGFEWKCLKDICDYVDFRGKTPKKTESGIFLVTAKNIKKGFIDYNASKEFVSESDYIEIMRRGLPRIGDVLITTEAPCGNVAQIDKEDIALAQRVIKYRSSNENILDNTFLKFMLLSKEFQVNLIKLSTGGTVKGIKGSTLHKMKIKIPPIDEQKRIVSILEKFEILTNSITEGLPLAIEQSQKRYEYYRELLLNFS